MSLACIDCNFVLLAQGFWGGNIILFKTQRKLELEAAINIKVVANYVLVNKIIVWKEHSLLYYGNHESGSSSNFK